MQSKSGTQPQDAEGLLTCGSKPLCIKSGLLEGELSNRLGQDVLVRFVKPDPACLILVTVLACHKSQQQACIAAVPPYVSGLQTKCL